MNMHIQAYIKQTGTRTHTQIHIHNTHTHTHTMNAHRMYADIHANTFIHTHAYTRT